MPRAALRFDATQYAKAMCATALCATVAAGGAAVAHPMTCAPTRADAARLERLDDAWREARSEAIAGGAARDLRALGPVADPLLKLNNPHPTPGRYLCRTIKLGAQSPDGLSYVAYGWFRCQVTLTPGGDLILRKLTGSQRPIGLICPGRTDSDTRFVGVLQLGDEVRTPPYGAEPDRDLIGEVRRTGDQRWRIAFPWPATESKLDLLELRRVR